MTLTRLVPNPDHSKALRVVSAGNHNLPQTETVIGAVSATTTGKICLRSKHVEYVLSPEEALAVASAISMNITALREWKAQQNREDEIVVVSDPNGRGRRVMWRGKTASLNGPEGNVWSSCTACKRPSNMLSRARGGGLRLALCPECVERFEVPAGVRAVDTRREDTP